MLKVNIYSCNFRFILVSGISTKKIVKFRTS